MSAQPLPRTPVGLVDGLSIEIYHACAGAVSNSGLSDFARSPAHYHALHLDPRRPVEEETPAQLVGQLAHCALLEPAEFGKRYAVGPVGDKRLKAWKTWAEDYPQDEDGSFTLLTPAQAAAAWAMAESAKRNPDVAKLLGKGRPEVSAFWIDKATGLACRCRPDWVSPAGRGVILADVKTCGDASPAQFARQVARMGYHRQAAFYSDGYAEASGLPVLGFVFIAIETAWPYLSSAVMLDDESLAKGREEIAALLPRFAACKASNAWPGYSDAIELVSLPAWALSTTTEGLQ